MVEETDKFAGTKADRKYHRERIPVPVTFCRPEGIKTTGGLVDISVGGVRVSVDHPPAPGQEVSIEIQKFRFHGKGTILRIYPTSIGYDVAVKFDREYPEVVGRMLEYKVRSLRR